MKYLKPSYFDSFICIADKCPDTCCNYWQVELSCSDIKKYTNPNDNSEIATSIRNAIKGKKEPIFKMNNNASCPFLNCSQLCDIQAAKGHSYLPTTCQLYPRFYNTFGGYEEMGLSFSCPAAADLIVKENFHLIESSDDKKPEFLTEINGELFLEIRRSRERIIGYLNKCTQDCNDIALSLLSYAKKVQKLIDMGKYNLISNLEIENISNCSENIFSHKKIKKTINQHKRHHHLKGDWSVALNNAHLNKPSLNAHQFKIWLIYFIYRYLINATKDYNFYSKILAAIKSYHVICSLEYDFKQAAQLYSKETEHNEFNIKYLFVCSKRI